MIITLLFLINNAALAEEEPVLYFSEESAGNVERFKPILGDHRFNIKVYNITSLFKNDLPSFIRTLYFVKGENEGGEISLFLVGNRKTGLKNYGELEYHGEIFNSAKGWFIRKEDTIIVETQYPFSSATYSVKYLWDRRNVFFIYIGDEVSDYSVGMLEKVDNFLQQGKIKKAAESLWDILYPQHYYNLYEMVIKFLVAGHREALRVYYRERNSQKAVEIMRSSFEPMLNIARDAYIPVFYSKEEFKKSEFSQFIKFNKYVRILNDFGFLLEQAGELKEAVDILSAVLKLSPKRVVAYLNMGDALWKKGNKKKARYYYTVYIKMMKNRKKEKQIPERVKRRTVW